MDYTIVSGATKGSEYVDCLKKQEIAFKDYHYMPFVVADRGKWEENTKIKPEVIRQAFKHDDYVLWIDSDCHIEAPTYRPLGDWDICIMNNIHPKHKCRISAGFIFFRNTPATHEFLALWEDICKKEKKDHSALMKALHRAHGYLKIGDMTFWLKGRHIINKHTPTRGVYQG